MSHNLPEVIVIPFEVLGHQYFEALRSMLFVDVDYHLDTAARIQHDQRIKQTYQESLRQIFDIMTYDFHAFQNGLHQLPKVEMFIDREICATPEKLAQLTAYVREVGVGLWFELYRFGYFNLPHPYYLDHPDRDFLTLRILF